MTVRLRDPARAGEVVTLTNRDAAAVILVYQAMHAEADAEIANLQAYPDPATGRWEDEIQPIQVALDMARNPEGYLEHVLAHSVPNPQEPHPFDPTIIELRSGDGSLICTYDGACQACDEGEADALHNQPPDGWPA